MKSMAKTLVITLLTVVVCFAAVPACRAESGIVYGFWPYWLFPSEYQPEWKALTHVAYYWWDINADGTFSAKDAEVAACFSTAVAQAHQHGVKAIVCIGSPFEFAKIDSVLANYREEFADNILNTVQAYGADGVNLDLEFPQSTNSVTGTSNTPLFEDLMKRIHTKLKAADPDCHVSFCSGCEVDDFQPFANSNLNQYVDAVLVCNYDNRKWSADGQLTAANSPYNDPSRYDLIESATDAQNYFDKGKIILALPLYGFDWQAASDQPGALIQAGNENFMMLKDILPNVQVYGRHWDAASNSPYYVYQSGGKWHQVWYDDQESLELKCDYAGNAGVAGVGFWALGYEGNGSTLLSSLINTGSINGNVKDGSGAGISGVTVSLTGSMAFSTTTANDGFYRFSGLAARRSYTVTPSKTDWSFTPVSISTNSLNGDLCGRDFTGSAGLSSVTVVAPQGNEVAVDSAVTVGFSKTMDHVSAEAAFSISPAVVGSFSWQGDTLRFQPSAALPCNTTFTVKVSTAAKDGSGGALAAAAVWQFTTVQAVVPQAALDRETVYPNPYIQGKNGSGSKVRIDNLPGSSTIRIYTLTGDLVATIPHRQTGSGGSEQWDISAVASGIYFYVISGDGVTPRKGKIGIVK